MIAFKNKFSQMKKSLNIGLSFGITSGIITTLGLIVGLGFGTESKLVVVGGILTIAIADSISDSLGIHISVESDKKASRRDIWESTISALLSKFLFTLTFLIPIFLVSILKYAILINIVWGLLAIAVLSFYIAKSQSKNIWHAIFEHVSIAVTVIVLTFFVGEWILLRFS